MSHDIFQHKNRNSSQNLNGKTYLILPKFPSKMRENTKSNNNEKKGTYPSRNLALR